MTILLDMPQKSDNLIFMRTITATEAARNFSEILDKVEHGEEIVIMRGKREIARMVPIKAEKPNGAALLKALTEWQANHPPTDEDDGAWDYYYESKVDPINQVRNPWEE